MACGVHKPYGNDVVQLGLHDNIVGAVLVLQSPLKQVEQLPRVLLQYPHEGVVRKELPGRKLGSRHTYAQTRGGRGIIMDGSSKRHVHNRFTGLGYPFIRGCAVYSLQ